MASWSPTPSFGSAKLEIGLLFHLKEEVVVAVVRSLSAQVVKTLHQAVAEARCHLGEVVLSQWEAVAGP